MVGIPSLRAQEGILRVSQLDQSQLPLRTGSPERCPLPWVLAEAICVTAEGSLWIRSKPATPRPEMSLILFSQTYSIIPLLQKTTRSFCSLTWASKQKQHAERGLFPVGSCIYLLCSVHLMCVLLIKHRLWFNKSVQQSWSQPLWAKGCWMFPYLIFHTPAFLHVKHW